MFYKALTFSEHFLLGSFINDASWWTSKVCENGLGDTGLGLGHNHWQKESSLSWNGHQTWGLCPPHDAFSTNSLQPIPSRSLGRAARDKTAFQRVQGEQGHLEEAADIRRGTKRAAWNKCPGDASSRALSSLPQEMMWMALVGNVPIVHKHASCKPGQLEPTYTLLFTSSPSTNMPRHTHRYTHANTFRPGVLPKIRLVWTAG